MTQRAIDRDYYFVTTVVHQRQWFFVTPGRAEKLGEAIKMCCRMKHFDLLAYCILPNHIHLLVCKTEGPHTLESVQGAETGDVQAPFLFPDRRLSSRWSQEYEHTVSDLMQSIKGTFSRTLQKGKFWHRKSYSRIMTSQQYLQTVLRYIENNYEKMKLPETYSKPPFVFIDYSKIGAAFGLGDRNHKK